MGLVCIFQLMEDARKRGYGLCYCEAWNLESLQAVLEAAEEQRSPIIVGFNGSFLAHPGRSRAEKLAYYAGLGMGLREAAVPVGFLLNESDDLDQLKQAIEMGFNGVMVENARLKEAEYEDLVARVVSIAHRRGVWVEAQVGHLPHSDGGQGQITDPHLARRFVAQTGIDALGVSVGNIHILTQGKARIDLDALQNISKMVEVPLVLHGGTGLPHRLAREIVRRGVVKFNFGTLLKQAYLSALRQALSRYRRPMNPHDFLGRGGSRDIMVAGKRAVKAQVKKLLQAYGSAGRADVGGGGRILKI